MRQIRNYVGGRFVDGVGIFPDVDPTTGIPVADVHEAGEALVDRAVAAARAAHDGPWRRTTVQERCGLLRRLADLVDVRAEDLVRAEVTDTGKPTAVARNLDVARAAANIRSFADIVAAEGVESYLLEHASASTCNAASSTRCARGSCSAPRHCSSAPRTTQAPRQDR